MNAPTDALVPVLGHEVLTLNKMAVELLAVADELAQVREISRPIYPLEVRVRHYLAARRSRQDITVPNLFADPAWDILLDLLASQREGRKVSVSSACIASSVPTTTAMRWLRRLLQAGVVFREADPTDSRRTFLHLSQEVAVKLEAWVERNLPGGGAV